MSWSSVSYSKWSAGGNTTLFFRTSLEKGAWVREALGTHGLCAEQAGFIDPTIYTLAMAGGEFCLNAARSFGAYLAWDMGEENTTIIVSGWPEPVNITCLGKAPLWHVRARLPLPPISLTELEPGIIKVALPGITHLLLDDTHILQHSDIVTVHAQMRKHFGLEEEACVGLVWWEQTRAGCAITPLVYVRDTQTTVWEQACGSGSLACALGLGLDACTIRQPSGANLDVQLAQDRSWAAVSGEVLLIAEGKYWMSF